MEMFSTLVGIKSSWVYRFIQTHWIIHLRLGVSLYVYFTSVKTKPTAICYYNSELRVKNTKLGKNYSEEQTSKQIGGKLWDIVDFKANALHETLSKEMHFVLIRSRIHKKHIWGIITEIHKPNTNIQGGFDMTVMSTQ